MMETVMQGQSLKMDQLSDLLKHPFSCVQLLFCPFESILVLPLLRKVKMEFLDSLKNPWIHGNVDKVHPIDIRVIR